MAILGVPYGRAVVVLAAVLVLAGSAPRATSDAAVERVTPAAVQTSSRRRVALDTLANRPTELAAVPALFAPPARVLRAGPVAVPLRIEIPSIGLDIEVVDVGMTAKHVMDAPEGGPADPVWQQAFWYRGSAVPGRPSTTLIAGHIDDPLGRAGAFARIDELHAGATISIRNTRTGHEVHYVVRQLVDYPLAATTEPAVIARMYGAGPAAGETPQRSPDGLAHLTLVTCAGTFDHSIETHDHRLAVYATAVA